MLFQIDIIPSVSGFGGISCESGVMIADKELRDSIASEYSEIWDRIVKRQEYMRNELEFKFPMKFYLQAWQLHIANHGY